MTLLPREPAPVDPCQAALTARFLWPAEAALMDLFTALRAETDRELGPRLPPLGDKPYPLGRCREIAMDVFARLGRRLVAPDHPGLAALAGFLGAGGVGRVVWGALRDEYFQNAMQFGAAYVDVANDTVDPAKPPVEIREMSAARLYAVDGPGHFARIARSYWQAEIFANHVLPSLAPLFPLFTSMAGGGPKLQAESDYMIAWCRRDRGNRTATWLADAAPLPPNAEGWLRARCPADLLAPPDAGPGPALAACRALAAQDGDDAWLQARIADFHRVRRACGFG